MEKTKKNISNTTCLAYGIGGLGEGIGYNFFFGFFLFFLTNTAGVSPAWAGTISMIAVFWDAVSDPLIGYMSDNSKNPKGRRRPFLFKGAIVLGVAIFLLFNNLNISPMLKVLYYILVNIVYWLSLTSCVIPHTSLGAELTDDFNKRTSIRAYQTFFMNIGAGIALSGTLIIVSFFSKFFTNSQSWAITAALFGIIVFCAYFICYICTKGKEPDNINLHMMQSNKKTISTKNSSFFRIYKNILKNKPLRYILVLDFAINFILGIAVSVRVYLHTYTFGFSDATSSMLLMLYSIIIVVGVFFSNLAAKHWGKKITMIIATLLYAFGFLIPFFLPATATVVAMGLILEGLGNCTFWTLLYSFAYDTSMIEVYKHGTGHEGVIVSMVGLIMKVGNAIGMWLCGLGLSFIGFNAELATQSPHTEFGLKFMYCIVSSVILIIGAIIFSKYPLTEDKYNILKELTENPSKSYDPNTLKNIL